MGAFEFFFEGDLTQYITDEGKEVFLAEVI